MPVLKPPPPPFSAAVNSCFSGGASAYDSNARLQSAIAARLERLCIHRDLRLPPGPRADLGAGSGLLSRALERGLGGEAFLRVDQCEALLRQETQVPQLQWDLNHGLPPQLEGAACLASSFALQWLEHPPLQLQQWCSSLQQGGWLLLAVPTRGSFPLWREAASRAAVPCTALELPDADPLIHRAEQQLEIHCLQRLRFSRPNPGGLAFLQQIKTLGAQASRGPQLTAGQLRRLLRCWPGAHQAILWNVLVLIGQKR